MISSAETNLTTQATNMYDEPLRKVMTSLYMLSADQLCCTSHPNRKKYFEWDEAKGDTHRE
jgi:hypothetical protein